MYLYYTRGEFKKKIGEPSTNREAIKMIKDYCQERGYKIRYIRMSVRKEDGGIEMKYDVGSHTEFFFLSPIDKK